MADIFMLYPRSPMTLYIALGLSPDTWWFWTFCSQKKWSPEKWPVIYFPHLSTLGAEAAVCRAGTGTGTIIVAAFSAFIDLRKERLFINITFICLTLLANLHEVLKDVLTNSGYVIYTVNTNGHSHSCLFSLSNLNSFFQRHTWKFCCEDWAISSRIPGSFV